MIHLHTNHGKISIELDAAEAPLGAENFLAYARDGFYDGTIFHRVIPGFMIQGGGFNADMKQKTTRDAIRNEAANGLLNEEGTVAWARTSDPHSATAQFFINLKDNDFLDHVTESPQGWGYSVFARVVDGMDTVRAIAGVKTGRSGMHQDVPVAPVIIERVEIEQ